MSFSKGGGGSQQRGMQRFIKVIALRFQFGLDGDDWRANA
jgi:hypothetical protein